MTNSKIRSMMDQHNWYLPSTQKSTNAISMHQTTEWPPERQLSSNWPTSSSLQCLEISHTAWVQAANRFQLINTVHPAGGWELREKCGWRGFKTSWVSAPSQPTEATNMKEEAGRISPILTVVSTLLSRPPTTTTHLHPSPQTKTHKWQYYTRT